MSEKIKDRVLSLDETMCASDGADARASSRGHMAGAWGRPAECPCQTPHLYHLQPNVPFQSPCVCDKKSKNEAKKQHRR